MKQIVLLALAGITGSLCVCGPAETGSEPNAAEQTMRLSERAMALYSHGRLAEAKSEFAAVRVELSQTVGPRDPATLNSRNNCAAVLFAMGDFAGAEALHRGTLKIRDEMLGATHPDALSSRQNLAVTLLREGKLEEALMNERCVESVRMHMLGANNRQSRQAKRLRMLIEDAMKNGDGGNPSPHGSPTGLGGSAVREA